jgi:aspartyl-tRNA(Asn)/glutamyl-tRNA(Gln) amidotransferase subunit A
MDDALDVLAAAGAAIEEVTFDHLDAVEAANRMILHAESFAFHLPTLRTHWHDYGSFTRLLLAQGAFVTGSDYMRAQRVRAMWCDQIRAIHDHVDVIVTPTIGVSAPRLDADFLALMPLFFTGLWNLTGSPALSMPAGFASGMPVGMQVVGRSFDEATVLRVGAAYQRRTDWHQRCP